MTYVCQKAATKRVWYNPIILIYIFTYITSNYIYIYKCLEKYYVITY